MIIRQAIQVTLHSSEESKWKANLQIKINVTKTLSKKMFTNDRIW